MSKENFSGIKGLNKFPTHFLNGISIVLFTVDAGRSPSEVDTDSCSDGSSLSSPESDLAEEECRALGDQITPNINNTDSLVDYGLNGDNLDWQRRPSNYSANRDTESIHWFNLLCYKNRITNWDLDDKDPIRPILDLPNSSFLPSLEEHAKLRADYIILLLRVVVQNCEYFKQFSKIVPGHIPHQFSKEMRKQSQVVS